MRYIREPICIFSVFTSQLSVSQNEVNHLDTLNELEYLGIDYVVLVGNEKSILVHQKHENTVREYCYDYLQDSYLVSHNDRKSELRFLDGRESLSLGILQTVDSVNGLQNYTIAPDGRIWTTESEILTRDEATTHPIYADESLRTLDYPIGSHTREEY